MSGGGIRTQPGRSVSTAASRRDAQERQRLADTELERVRRAAAAWQTGLAALLGVVTVVPVVKGRETIVGISPEAGILVGVLLGLALIAGTSGLCLALRAAHGLPATRRGGDAGRVARLQAASAAADDLRRAIAATVLTVAAIAAAVAVTWYAEAVPPAFVEATARTRAGERVACGELRSDGPLALETDAGVVRIDPARLRALKLVGSCP